jgi:hypothetical protein
MRKTKKDYEKQIRQLVEKKIGRNLPDLVWNYMKHVQNFEMDDAYPDEDEKVRTLVDEFEKLSDIAIALGGGRKRRPRQPREWTQVMEPVIAESSPEENLRAETLKPYIGKIAGAHPSVAQFREKVLREQLLEMCDIYNLITSPAAYCLSPDEFARLEIPVVGHRVEDAVCTVLSGGGILKLRVALQIAELNQTLTVTSPPYLPDCGWVADDPDVSLQKMPESTKVPLDMITWPGSVIDQLNAASDYLVETFGCDEMDAKVFVLTGECPDLRPVVARCLKHSWDCYTHSRILISVEPWITTKTLINNFLEVQRKVLGRRNRRLSERQLRLCQLVWCLEDELPSRGKWKIVQEKWNQWCLKNDKKEWCYEHVDHVSSDYNRVAKILAGGQA